MSTLNKFCVIHSRWTSYEFMFIFMFRSKTLSSKSRDPKREKEKNSCIMYNFDSKYGNIFQLITPRVGKTF